MAFEKHLLVDGSNIMHAWPELRALLKRDRDAARFRLSEAVRVLHDVEQIRVTIVFDGRGDALTIERPGEALTFTHLHTPDGVTADDVIEKIVGRTADPSTCIVATDDRAEQQTAEALSAVVLSSADLSGRIERASQRQQAQVSGLKRENEREWRRPKS